MEEQRSRHTIRNKPIFKMQENHRYIITYFNGANVFWNDSAYDSLA